MSSLTTQPEWQHLKTLAESIKDNHMRDWFNTDPQRADKMQAETCGLFLDYSKKIVTRKKIVLVSIADPFERIFSKIYQKYLSLICISLSQVL